MCYVAYATQGIA